MSITDVFVGTWTYRSFLINPDISVDFNDLEFGRGQLIIESFTPGAFSGRLTFGPTYQFKLTGASSYGNPYSLRFQGVGDTSDSQNQVYDYEGYLVPIWPNGINQRPAIVGSVIRTVSHNGGQAHAGIVCSWIAMKQDT
jgi:hypothetical protein